MRSRRIAAGLLAAAAVLTACSGGDDDAAPDVDPANWSSVLDAAKGQTVDFYTYGGDTTLNAFLGGYVANRLRTLGVTLKQVRVDDTADAVNKVVGQKQAGRTSGGAVDAIWINGENFATGVQAKLWYCGWASKLPNSRFVDFDDPAVANDFGLPVKGCESAWQRANSALVYDSAELTPADVASVQSLFAWSRANPGRFTYPAPPDFTGSLAVRSILYAELGGPAKLPATFDESAYTAATDPLWKSLNAVEPTLWRRGATYPQTQDAVEKLYADGEISAFFTYGPGAVGDQVAKKVFPASTREAVLAGGNIGNVSNVAIPADAGDRAGALVLANVLQDPATQLALYKAEGIYPAIDLAKTSAAVQRSFAAVPRSPSVLDLPTLTKNAQPELSSDYLTRIEKDWRSEVLQR